MVAGLLYGISAHDAAAVCSTDLGVLAQGVSPAMVRRCNLMNGVQVIAFVGAAAGMVLVLTGILRRTMAPPAPPMAPPVWWGPPPPPPPSVPPPPPPRR